MEARTMNEDTRVLATQRAKILHHLQTHEAGITPLDALNLYGCFRLSGVVFQLRKQGYIIETARNTNGKHYARYFLNG